MRRSVAKVMTQVDPSEVLAALGRHEPASATPVHGGADAQIWRVEQSGSVYALRLLPPTRMDQAAREEVSMTFAAIAGLPVPKVIDSGSWNDHQVILLEWVNGTPIAAFLLSNLGEVEAAESIGTRFGKVQAAIHKVDPPVGFRTNWHNWPVANAELTDHFATIAQRSPALLHLDYHPMNVLVDGGEITAVLDWANAHAGDPRADLARTLSIVQLAPTPEHSDSAKVEITLQSFEKGWRRGYEESGGSFDGLEPFCWWAGLAMHHDLAPRVGRSDLPWLTSDYLERVRRWTAEWRETSKAVS